ncbi:MAG: hypothetical protein IT267_08050 [Saprospiraceae bacterium]|nr:hypothetical protein [Saprospiraceae bacterium]
MKTLINFILVFLLISCNSDKKDQLKENVVKFANGSVKKKFYSDKNEMIQDTMWEYYSTGELSSIRIFKDNKQTGRNLYYLKEGPLYEIQNYIDGKIEGIDTVYYPSGQIKVLGTFKDGLRNGPFKIFKEDGTIENEFNYRNDSIIVSQ